MQQESILILDFGSQYTQLIARRVRELNVYCEIHPYTFLSDEQHTKINNLKGIILSGSPFSVRQKDAPLPDLSALRKKIPLLGVCYGAQLLAFLGGGEVKASNSREYGRANLSFFNKQNRLFKNISSNSQVWMSHADTITEVPENFE